MSTTPTLAEEYIGRAQHRIVVRVMQALATVQSSMHIDEQLAAVALQLKQPAPDTDDEPFEVALGMMIASYAGGKMFQARENVRTMHAHPGHHEETLELIDRKWKRALNATVLLNHDTSAAIRDYDRMYPAAAAGATLLRPLLMLSPVPMDNSRPVTPQSPAAAAAKCDDNEDDEIEISGWGPPPRRRCMPVRYSSYVVGKAATFDDDDDDSPDYLPFA
jgi:hypothetical protein